MAFSSDGAKMFVVGFIGDDVNEYDLHSVYPITVTDPPPTFVSSELDSATGVLAITFSEEIDATPATNVVPTKIHVRESGSYTGGITLSCRRAWHRCRRRYDLVYPDCVPHLATVAGLATPELTIEPGAVRDTSDNLIVGTFDASTAVFVDAFSVSSEETNPLGMAFSSDGTKMFVVGNDGDDVNEYALSTAFDASTAVFVDVTFSVSSQETGPTGMAFSNDGAKMFVVGNQNDSINEYALSAAFDASTATFVDATSVSQDPTPQDVAFSNGGTKMFVVGLIGAEINEYALSTAFDASTATFVDTTSVSPQETAPTGMAFSNDGAKMFVVGNAGQMINEYTLSAAFDASTAEFVDAFSVSSQETAPQGMAFSSDGAKMFVVGTQGDDVNEYDLHSVYPITVTGMANAAPVLGAIGAKSVNELAALSFTATASDADNDALEFTLAGTPPSGASITSGGAFSWTPSESQDGTHAITIQVEDGNGGSDSEAVTVTVSEVNEDPVLNPIGPKSVNKLEALTFTATASDGDVIGGTADTLEFSLVGAPTGASINQNTGAFSWTPTAGQVGTHTVTVQVEDGAGATDSEAVTVTVTESNENPVLGAIGARSVNELATLSLTATATDGDNDTLEFTLAGTPPSGASITSGGAFSWTPSESQDGTHTTTIQVEDGNGGIDFETITVTVIEVNADPVLASVGSRSVDELASLAFTATATDGDVIGGTADTLEFSLVGAPTGASINQNTGAFSWTPSESQDGTHAITIQVEDGAGATDSEAVTVTVSEVNEDPVLNPIGPKSVNQLETLTFTATASDGDVTGGTADTLEFSLVGAPTGASINQNTGSFSWTPTASQVGTHTITFQVEDGAGATDSEAVTVTVSESNENPVLGAIGAKSVNELAALTFTATATDGDNDALTFTLVGTPPSGASITSAGSFSWTPSESQDGTHSVTARVSDGNGGSDSETITVTVGEVNQDPALNPIGPKGVNRPGTLAFTATASDGDVIGGTADSLEFSLAGTPPSGASITSAGAFSWTPTASQIGTHTITIQVEDGSGAADSGAVTVRVTADSVDPPTTRSGGGGGGGGSSKQAHALALDLGTVRSTGLASTPQEIVLYLGTFDPDEPIRPTGDAGQSDPPLVINGSAYLLGGTHNTLEPQALRPGEPTDITFTVYSTADIVRFAVNMSRQGADAGPPANYTLIRFSDGAVSTVDPGGLIADADVAITRVSGAAYKYRVQADVEFADVTGLTDMVITSENARGASTTVHVASAFEVLPPAAAQAEPDAPAPEPEPEPDMPAPEPDAPSYHEPPASPTAAFRMWAGFGPATIGDAGLAAALGLDYPGAEIPTWVKTGLAPLVVNGYATVDEFATALEYVLGAIQDRGARDAAGSQPADTDPDAAAPTVASIERSDPVEESTSETTLVFGVTFSEDVTGVDAGDFELSPDSGSGPGQFTHTRTPGLAIPDNAAAVSDAITVPGFGTATSVTVSVDIAHPFIGDLTVELVAPDGTARTLHDRSGDNADGIEQTYTPDFDGTGIAGDWTLRASDGASGDAGTLNGWTLTVAHDGAGGSVTGLAGSGSQYLVTVSAPQGGTYNLDVAQDNGIADMAGNPLSGTTPRGQTTPTPSHDADTTAPTVMSIERSDPAGESTSETTLVFGVTFARTSPAWTRTTLRCPLTAAAAPDSSRTPGRPGLPYQTTPRPYRMRSRCRALGPPRRSPSPWTSRTRSSATSWWSSSPPTAPPGRCTTAAATMQTASNQTYTPDFDGTGIAGDWTLRASDGASGDAGTLNGWTLTIGHDGAGGSVTGLAGSGSQYLVTVSVPQGGTYNLDVAQDNGIADAAGNPLAGTDPTGPDHTYTVVADTAAPAVMSIERSDPAGESTSETTLVFGVTFSEDVTGVDAGRLCAVP